MRNITEKVEHIYKYISALPLSEPELKTLDIIYETYFSLDESTKSIEIESRVQMIKYQYKMLKKLARKAETRIFRLMTPFDAFIYRYLLKHKSLLPNYFVYNFTDAEIRQRLDKSISLGIQEIVIENELMPSLSSKLLFHSFDGLLNVVKVFLNSVKPEMMEQKFLYQFIDKVFENYNFIPYHNFAHAVNVLQFFEYMIKRTALLSNHYTQETIFWVYIACICHDMAHFGKNNTYYIKKKHNLVFKSFEKSVLEHYHCEKTLKIMSDSDCDIMAYGDANQKAYFKRIIIEAILATDMSKHFGLLEQFNALDLSSQLKDDDFFKLTGYLIHSSDVANPALDFDNYLLWAELVSQEFHLQTLSEKKHGLTVMPFFEYGGREAFLKGQCGFINSFVMPLFKAIAIKAGNYEFENQCTENVKTLEEMLTHKLEDGK